MSHTVHNRARAALTRAELFTEALETFTLATLTRELASTPAHREKALSLYTEARADLVQATLDLRKPILTVVT